MQLLQKIVYPKLRTILFRSCRHIHSERDAIVVASAVRTPWGYPLGEISLVRPTALITVALEAAIKQAGAPLEKIKHISVVQKSCGELQLNLDEICNGYLKKANIQIENEVEQKHSAYSSLVKSIGELMAGSSEFVVVGGVETASEIPHNQGVINNGDYYKSLHHRATFQGLYDVELVPLRILQQLPNQRRFQIEIEQDEVNEENSSTYHGAAALVLTTMAKALEYNIKPLAKLKDYNIVENADIEKMPLEVRHIVERSNVDISQIMHWEINNNALNTIQDKFNIPEYINPYGCSYLTNSSAASLYRMLTHMSHSLQPYNLGGLIHSNDNDALIALMEKLHFPNAQGTLPRLTLFTKDPCHLCEMLVVDLEMNFLGEYELEKVYIDKKENVRFLRLYRHDIPVLYLNGQFLCMHRLNARVLRQKLDMLKKRKQIQ
ncbi:acetyl-CoA acetyltransferase, mitochondrial [Musca domestica]|uniref:Acetyl-CoA acetyltransferase, mitochondrial n=1 Tax=Musca domestica TaxID=7370 RepID=A0A1I8MV40_MUSDO|nr:acetyl-CoA acetyltransferase, mitochondrial [Musca domestica]